MAEDDAPPELHPYLVRWGPGLLGVVGLVLIACSVILDRDWLAPVGVASLLAGVVLPRVQGDFEATATGVKARVVDHDALAERVRRGGADLSEDARARAQARAKALAVGYGLDDVLTRLNELAEPDRLDAVAGLALEDARREWYVTFKGSPLTGEARDALDAADDVVLIGGHSIRGMNSHTVIVNAVTATEAVNRAKRRLDGLGTFVAWEVEPWETPFGFFEKGDDDDPASAEPTTA